MGNAVWHGGASRAALSFARGGAVLLERRTPFSVTKNTPRAKRLPEKETWSGSRSHHDGGYDMHDGRTRKVDTLEGVPIPDFLEANRISLTLVSGTQAGTEYTLEGLRTIVGRSPKAAIQLDDESVSSEHAAFEVGPSGIQVRDLASTNGTCVNGETVVSAPLAHGDRVLLGDCELQLVVEARERPPRVWSVGDDA